MRSLHKLKLYNLMGHENMMTFVSNFALNFVSKQTRAAINIQCVDSRSAWVIAPTRALSRSDCFSTFFSMLGSVQRPITTIDHLFLSTITYVLSRLSKKRKVYLSIESYNIICIVSGWGKFSPFLVVSIVVWFRYIHVVAYKKPTVIHDMCYSHRITRCEISRYSCAITKLYQFWHAN